MLGKVVEESQRVGFTPAKLGRQIEDRRGLGGDAVETPHNLRGEFQHVFREKSPAEKPLRVRVNLGRSAIANLVEMHSKFGGVERPAFAQILAR